MAVSLVWLGCLAVSCGMREVQWMRNWARARARALNVPQGCMHRKGRSLSKTS